MTATSTVERSDWSTVLGGSPVCEYDDCGQEATHRIGWACGCATLACQAHVDHTVAWVAGRLAEHDEFECVDCHRRTAARSVSDLIRVTPL